MALVQSGHKKDVLTNNINGYENEIEELLYFFVCQLYLNKEKQMHVLHKYSF